MRGSALFEYQMFGGALGAAGAALFEYQMFDEALGTAPVFGAVPEAAGPGAFGGVMYGWPITRGENQMNV